MRERILFPALIIVAVLGLTTIATAQPIPPDATIDQVLGALHDRGQHLQSFSADVSHAETDTNMDSTTTRTGTVVYQARPGGGARLHVLFIAKSVNDKPPHPDRVEYLLDNDWLTKRDYPSQIETDYQVSQPGQKVNLFQLGKGPFPLPIGQTPQAVHDAFDVTKAPPADGDPPNTIHLKLVPRPQTDLARKFAQIDVWVDRTLAMPVRIETQGAGNDGTDRQTDLHHLRVNPRPAPGDADFALPKVEGRWDISREPLQQ